MSCRLFDEKFPDVSKHLKVKGEKLTFPKTINEMLDRASVFSKRDSRLDEILTISVSEKSIKIKAKSDSAWFEESAKGTFKGEPIEFNITPYLLRDILKEEHSAIIGDKKLLFEGENWKYLTLLRG